MKLNVLKFALAGGILIGGVFLISTIFALLNIPGFREFAVLLEAMYGAYGYSISFAGIFIGLIWGFIEGFVQIGFLVYIYNLLNKKRK